MQRDAAGLPLDDAVVEAILALRRELHAAGIAVSDRRWKKLVQVLRIASAALGRQSVDRTMLILLQHMIWKRPEERATIRKLLIEICPVALSGKGDLHAASATALLKDYVRHAPPARFANWTLSGGRSGTTQIQIFYISLGRSMVEQRRTSLHLPVLSMVHRDGQTNQRPWRSYILEMWKSSKRFSTFSSVIWMQSGPR